MERDYREKQTPIKFRRRKISSDTEKNSDLSPAALKNIGVGANDDSMKSIESPTPEKFDQKLSSIEKQHHENSSSQDILSEAFVPEITLKPTELPEKLKSLAELFDRMISSIRLLGLRKRLSTFQNICTQVEIMSRRKFSYGNLAQMKYAFPDAIQIEKVLMHDERTLCMIPDLKVNIIFDIVGCPYPGQSASMALCDAFRVRLFEHLSANQDAEIPEAVLPEPFNQRNIIKTVDSLSEKSPSELTQQASVGADSIINFSHFSSSFRKKFCEKIVPEAELPKVLASSLPAISDDFEVRIRKNSDTTSLPDVKSFLKSIYIPNLDQLVESTPVKGISTVYVDQISGDITAETPDMQTPKRPMPSPVEILVTTTEKAVSESKSMPSVRRTLIYSPQKLDSTISKFDFGTEEHTRVHEQLSDGDVSCKRNICTIEENITRDAIAGSKGPQKWSQSNSEKRQALLDFLPAIFDTIHFICQSVDCSLITKQELVHKIISNNLDIEETSQVEEQLGLLEQLVPDWMSKKSACNGEFLYCIKRVSDPNAVRIRLSEAV